ncbi:MAG: ABC transporter ATP-binding protein [Lachnospiraceae bacterium]|nr:ABC transporter ATP-binding protein [Lachnospiraceae bacterium]
MNTLECKGIVKKFGSNEVLHGVDVTLEKGKIYGLIGRNGAGKTTLLSIASGQNPATAGEVTVEDLKVWDNQDALDKICFSRELNITAGNTGIGGLKVKDYLKAARIYFPNYDKAMEEKLVREFELDVKKRLSKLSKGMLSMVTIIVALASKSEYTFFDEPVAGLDVVARETFYKILLDEFAESGRTFVISTHIIEEAADIFEEVLFLDKGNIILKENTQELVGRAVHVSGVAEEVEKIAEGKTVYHMETLGRSKAATILLEPGEELKNTADITVQPMNLQQVFVAMCGKEA